jgi:hypothetical protein
VTTRDAEWTPDDRAYALAWQAEQRLRCGGCHRSRSETMDREAEGTFQATPWRCHACATRDKAAAAFAKEGGDLEGLQWAVIPRSLSRGEPANGKTGAG